MAVTLGLDFGTNSVRALLVRCEDGEELGVGECVYPSGQQGVILDRRNPHLARQHPGDYLIGIEKSVAGAMERARAHPSGFDPKDVIGIGVDTTGSS